MGASHTITIVGCKGSGKTALFRKLEEIHSSELTYEDPVFMSDLPDDEAKTRSSTVICSTLKANLEHMKPNMLLFVIDSTRDLSPQLEELKALSLDSIYREKPPEAIVSVISKVDNKSGAHKIEGKDIKSIPEKVAKLFAPVALSPIHGPLLSSIYDQKTIADINDTFSNEATKIALKKKVEKFKKIYTALRDGQSAWFYKTNFLSGKENKPHTELAHEIEQYAARYPNSRTKKAWDLAGEHEHKGELHTNTNLVKDIYLWSFEKSGLFFKRSCCTGDTYMRYSTLSDHIRERGSSLNYQLFSNPRKDEEKQTTRLGKIRKALTA